MENFHSHIIETLKSRKENLNLSEAWRIHKFNMGDMEVKLFLVLKFDIISVAVIREGTHDNRIDFNYFKLFPKASQCKHTHTHIYILNSMQEFHSVFFREGQCS